VFQAVALVLAVLVILRQQVHHKEIMAVMESQALIGVAVAVEVLVPLVVLVQVLVLAVRVQHRLLRVLQ
jgi:hypothetical protein